MIVENVTRLIIYLYFYKTSQAYFEEEFGASTAKLGFSDPAFLRIYPTFGEII